MKQLPPKLPLRFFRWFCHPKLRDSIEGDLMELYAERKVNNGKWKADVHFIKDVLLLFRPGIIRPTEGTQALNAYGMYKSYLKVGWRNLVRNKGFSLINISGLTIGMAVALFIGLWVHYELSFNRTFDKYERLGLMYHNLTFGEEIISYEGVPYPYVQELKNNYSEFEEVVAFFNKGENVVAIGDKKFSRPCYFVEPNFTEIFSIRMLHGTQDGLKEKYSILLSKSLADALVGDDPIGKLVKYNNRDELVVTGVYENFPENSVFAGIQMLIPVKYYFTLNDYSKNLETSWGALDASMYFVLQEGASWEATETKIKDFLYSKTTDAVKAVKPQALLQPMSRMNLYAEFKDGKNVGGKIRFVWMFVIVGSFVLLLACINFMNLSTARSEKRSREVGIRKAMGSLRQQLISQFISESFLVVLMAFALALGIVISLMPAFNDLAGTRIEIPWTNPYFINVIIGFIIITSFLAGSYPALYLSSFHPIKVLKGSFRTGSNSTILRKALVVFQFAISTVLIIGTVVVLQQIQYAKDRSVGFDLSGIIYIPIKTDDIAKADYNSIRHDLLATDVVDNVAKSDFPITGGMTAEANMTWPGKNSDQQSIIALNRVSHDFPATNGFHFIEGRDFSRDYITDSSAIIINEMAAHLFSPNESAIGKKISVANREHHIIGIIKDQIRWTPYSKQSPHIYLIDYYGSGALTIRLKPGESMRETLMKIESVLRKYDPGTPFDYKFVDEDYARLFKSEEQIGQLASIFSALAIFISCIGIFGLASFAASQRTKEIGIRKVLGASAFTVWKLLSREFVILTIIALVLSFPVALYLSNDWLQQYDYRIDLSWSVFIWTGLMLFVITLATVSYQALKAAWANPVKSLRSE